MQKLMQQVTAATVILFLFQSCGRGAMESAPLAEVGKEAVAADSVATLPVADINSPLRKVIRTADIRCRVKDVYVATEQLEREVTAMGGQVSESSLENVQSEMKELPYKADSLKQVRSYTTVAYMTLRVPSKQLDSVLHTMPQLADFLESRHLKLEDVTYGYQANELKNQSVNRVDAAMGKAKKTEEVLSAANYESGQREAAIDRKMENLETLDQVNYSTLKVALFQPQKVEVLVVSDPQSYMKAGMGNRLMLALRTGREILEDIVVGLVTIWPLYIIALLGIGGYRLIKRRWSPVRVSK
ncbi:DUF4349 domain-containing protein [Chitinophagaceae bacterium MMS25-I14]